MRTFTRLDATTIVESYITDTLGEPLEDYSIDGILSDCFAITLSWDIEDMHPDNFAEVVRRNLAYAVL